MMKRSSTRLRWLVAVLATSGALVWLARVVVPAAAFEVRHVNYGDFGRFHFSARRYLDGQSMYVPVPADRRAPGQELRQRTDLTPPHAHLPYIPLAALPLPGAFAMFTLLNLSAAVWCGYAVARELMLDLDPAAWLAVAAIAVSSMPVAATIISGQPSFLYLIPVVLAWRAHRHGSATLAGAWLGGLASVKPFFGVFAIYFLLRYEWRALAAMTAVAIGAFLAGLGVFGWNAHASWLRDLASITWIDNPANSSIFGLAARSGIRDAPLWALLGGSVTAAVLAIRGTRSIDRHWLVLVALALLLAPLGWLYYWPWLAVPAVAVASVDPPTTRAGRIAFLGGCASAWWVWIPPLHGPLVDATSMLSPYTWGLLLMLLSQLPRRRPAASH